MTLDVYSFIKVWVRDTVEVDADTEEEAINKVLEDNVSFMDTEVIWSGNEERVSREDNNDNPVYYIKNGEDKIIYKE